MKNGLPYLSEELFWDAIEDIDQNTTPLSGDPLPELKALVQSKLMDQDVHPAAPTHIGLRDPDIFPQKDSC